MTLNDPTTCKINLVVCHARPVPNYFLLCPVPLSFSVLSGFQNSGLAYLYLYLQKSAFGGHITNRSFGTATTGPPRLNLLTLQTTLEQAWERLTRVTVECLDFRKLIPKYDRQHTLFFLDPPYYNIPGYNHDFVDQDFIDLANILKNINGHFLMTLNDCPQVRTFFKDFQIEEIQLKYSIAMSKKSRAKKRTELLISN